MSTSTNMGGNVIVLPLTEDALRRDYERIRSRFDAEWEKIHGDHALAKATLGSDEAALAKAANPLEEQNRLLKRYLADSQLHHATLEKVRDWLIAHNRTIDEHAALVERSRRARARLERFAVPASQGSFQ